MSPSHAELGPRERQVVGMSGSSSTGETKIIGGNVANKCVIWSSVLLMSVVGECITQVSKYFNYRSLYFIDCYETTSTSAAFRCRHNDAASWWAQIECVCNIHTHTHNPTLSPPPFSLSASATMATQLLMTDDEIPAVVAGAVKHSNRHMAFDNSISAHSFLWADAWSASISYQRAHQTNVRTMANPVFVTAADTRHLLLPQARQLRYQMRDVCWRAAIKCTVPTVVWPVK